MKTTTTETSIPEEKTTSTRIQAYSKSQLAALYLPHIQPASRPPDAPQLDCQKHGTASGTRPFGIYRKSNPVDSCTSRAVLSIFGRALESSPVPDEPTSRLIYSYSGHIRQREPESAALGKRPAQPYHVPFLTKNNIPNPDRTAVHLRVGNIFISQCTDLRTSKPVETSVFPAEDYTKFSQYLSYLNSSSIFLRSLSPTGSFSPFLNTVTSFLNLISIKNFLFPSR